MKKERWQQQKQQQQQQRPKKNLMEKVRECMSCVFCAHIENGQKQRNVDEKKTKTRGKKTKK